MQIQAPEPWYVKHGLNVLTSAIPLVLYWMASKKESQKKHVENQDLLRHLVREHEERPAHIHQEDTGPLMAENIQYAPPKRFNGMER